MVLSTFSIQSLFTEIFTKNTCRRKIFQKIRKMPRIHLNHLLHSSFDAQFNAQYFIYSHLKSFYYENLSYSLAKLTVKNRPLTPALRVRLPTENRSKAPSNKIFLKCKNRKKSSHGPMQVGLILSCCTLSMKKSKRAFSPFKIQKHFSKNQVFSIWAKIHGRPLYKSQRHREFPCSLLSWYYPGPT